MVTSKDLQDTLSYVNGHELTLSNTWNKNDIHGRITRRKPRLTKKKTAACLQFDQEHEDKTKWQMTVILTYDFKRQTTTKYCFLV